MLNELLAALNDCVWAFDMETQKFVFMSPSVQAVSGYSAKEFNQNTKLWVDIIDPRDREEVLASHIRPIGEEWVEFTYRIVTKSQKVKWIHRKKRHIIDPVTGHELVVCIFKDVSDQKLVNFTLHDSFGDFSVLFNDNPNPMWIYELPTLRILKVNEAAIEHYGYSEQEFTTMTIRDIRPRIDLSKFNEYMYHRLAHESKFDSFNNAGIWRHQNKKGEIIYAEVTGHEIKYDNHSCRIIIATDVTEKVLQQEEMKRREQFLTSLIDSQTNFLVRVDPAGHFTFVNKQFMKALGYKKSDLMEQHFSVTTIPEEKKLCEDTFNICIESPGKVVHMQHRKMDNGGNIHWVNWEFISIINHQGEVTEIQGVGQDITSSAEIEKQAQKIAEEVTWTKNNLEALINNTEDLTWSIDRQGRYVYMNSAYRKRITDTVGIQPKEGDDAYIHSGSTDQVRAEWRSYYERALSGERYVTMHESPDPNTKEISSFEVSFNPIYKAAKNEIIGVGCFARNVTGRLKAEEALIEQNERLKHIASLSSHELRRPVASMLGLLNILDRENFTNPENEQIIEHLFTVSNEIDEVIRLIVNKTFIDSRYSL